MKPFFFRGEGWGVGQRVSAKDALKHGTALDDQPWVVPEYPLPQSQHTFRQVYPVSTTFPAQVRLFDQHERRVATLKQMRVFFLKVPFLVGIETKRKPTFLDVAAFCFLSCSMA